MAPRSIPCDTDPEVFRRQVERWRTMTVGERAALIERLCADVERIAVAGIVAESPDLTEVEIRHELTRRRYGADLADEARRHLLARQR